MLCDFIKMIYWDGVDVNSDKCVCGIECICVNRIFWCNCDMNDEEWCEDSGFFINKMYLFVR